jgi:hypothetical protein
MKTVAGALILAVVLIVSGLVCLAEARVLRQAAAEQQRLATLRYADEEAEAGGPSLLNRLTLPFGTGQVVETQRASVTYWQARYEALTPLTGVTGDRQASDPNVLMIAANATFRASHPEAASSGRAAVEQLDGVMQAYGDVLRADPANVDAAYNYEFVARLRDVIAKGRPAPRARPASEIALSDDLPAGPTLHGRPGGPPPEVAMKDFKTFSPLQTDERGDLMEVGRQAVPRKRG